MGKGKVDTVTRPQTSTSDTNIRPFRARRARAKTLEIKGSHVIMVSQPQAVSDVILEALQAVAKPVAGVGARK